MNYLHIQLCSGVQNKIEFRHSEEADAKINARRKKTHDDLKMIIFSFSICVPSVLQERNVDVTVHSTNINDTHGMKTFLLAPIGTEIHNSEFLGRPLLIF